MKPRRIALAAVVFASLNLAWAHRMDEYLQATFIAVEQDQIRADLFLTPGVAVFPTVLAEIDTDKDGECSPAEQRSYATRVARDLSLAMNGTTLTWQLASFDFPTLEEIRAGRGDVHLERVAKLPPGTTGAKFRFENRHLHPIAAYQVNCLASRSEMIRIGRQQRDPLQSVFEIEVAFAR